MGIIFDCALHLSETASTHSCTLIRQIVADLLTVAAAGLNCQSLASRVLHLGALELKQRGTADANSSSCCSSGSSNN